MRNPSRPTRLGSSAWHAIKASWPAFPLAPLLLLTSLAIPPTTDAQVVENPSPRIARKTPASSEPLGQLDSRLVARQRELYQELSVNLQALQAQSSVLRKIVYVVRPSVVHIIADKKPPASQLPPGAYGDYGPEYSETPLPSDAFVEEAGSGVLIAIDAQPYVLTNRHVIRDATIDHIHVEFANGHRTVPAKVWSDESTDVALLALNDKNALPARLGNSDQVEIGDFVLAIGSPFGLSHSVTHGIISAKGRRDLTLGVEDVRIQDFLQTDAAINPGNSGGPLINMCGEVIGLNTAIASNSGGNEGIGFSIPINLAVHVARQLIQRGSLARPYLGVRLDHTYDGVAAKKVGLPRRLGTRVAEVTPGSPADQAELQAGDVILRFNDVEIEDDGHLVNLVGLSPPGVEAPLQVYRNGKNLTLVVDMVERGEEHLGDDTDSMKRSAAVENPSEEDITTEPIISE